MGRKVVEDLGGVDGRETVVRRHCMRKEFSFNKRVEKKKENCTKKDLEQVLFCLNLSILIIIFPFSFFEWLYVKKLEQEEKENIN